MEGLPVQLPEPISGFRSREINALIAYCRAITPINTPSVYWQPTTQGIAGFTRKPPIPDYDGPFKITLENAFTVIGWYKERWLIEEYFKALKTGCKMESRQLRGGQALESLCGLLCVTAFEIFRLKRMALTCPDRASREVVPSRWVDLLCAVRGCPRSEVETVYGFYRMLARLGGFLGRKSDGEPGWQKLWTGWDRLATMARGAEAFAAIQYKKSG